MTILIALAVILSVLLVLFIWWVGPIWTATGDDDNGGGFSNKPNPQLVGGMGPPRTYRPSSAEGCDGGDSRSSDDAMTVIGVTTAYQQQHHND